MPAIAPSAAERRARVCCSCRTASAAGLDRSQRSDNTFESCRDGGIRTRGLLLPNQLRPAARRSLTSPRAAFAWDNAGLTSPYVAPYLCMLAPTLAPSQLVVRRRFERWPSGSPPRAATTWSVGPARGSSRLHRESEWRSRSRRSRRLQMGQASRCWDIQSRCGRVGCG
jgi:hypothetical protein